ncbi:hypothetical protein CS542_03075 [Pedobacter sp. IW39]|nr:hypothetical protein CS542_03075 [Pedobacter sp. IW39]
MIGFMDKFKDTQDYRQFVESLQLYKSLENRKVNLEEWILPSLFVKMGFTQMILMILRSLLLNLRIMS